MKTYLVPVDFSEAAYNAAEVAALLSHQNDVDRIVLMNAYYISPYEQLLPNPDMFMLREQEIAESIAERIDLLNQLKNKLTNITKQGVQINVRINRSHLVRAVVDCVEEEQADLVLVGSIGNSTVRENGVGIGSHVTRISKISTAPVLVIPPSFTNHQIKRILIACDFKKIQENVPAHLLHKLLGKQDLELLVVNVDTSGKHAAADPLQLAEETALHHVLSRYNPEYHYIAEADVMKGVLKFAVEHDADLIIALPHKYSFLQSLVHSSVSRRLASCASVPVLLLK